MYTRRVRILKLIRQGQGITAEEQEAPRTESSYVEAAMECRTARYTAMLQRRAPETRLHQL